MSYLIAPSPTAQHPLIALWYQHYGPTWLMLIGVYGAWLGLTMTGGNWPGWMIIGVGGIVLCAHASLQHELIHGHLGISQRGCEHWANIPLSLWLPYPLYRDSHLAHHECPELTDHLGDPESYYVSDTLWQQMGSWRRGLLWCNQTLLGRLLMGPWLVWTKVYRDAWRVLRQGDPAAYRLWLAHLLRLMLVLGWLIAWEFPLLSYGLLVVWPGTSLMLLRSFHEHRVAASQAEASVVVEAGSLWRWLFLNNNYHVVHHRHPQLPWFRLHQCYWQNRQQWLVANGDYCYPGYVSWFWRFGLLPRDTPRWVSGTIAASDPWQTTVITPEESAGHAQYIRTPVHGDRRCPEPGTGG